eukprot:s1056_g6.t1
MGALGNSAELEAELIKRNREIAKVRDELIKQERRLQETLLRNDDLLEKVSVLDSEVTKKTTLLNESERKASELQEALDAKELKKLEEGVPGEEGHVPATTRQLTLVEGTQAGLMLQLARLGAEMTREQADSAQARPMVRFIADMRRSGVNGMTFAEERIVLPRGTDFTKDILDLPELDQAEVELYTADFTDAFLNLPIDPERQFAVVLVGTDQFAAYRGVPFGLATAPLEWGRMSAWLGRATQALHPPWQHRLQIYVDDPAGVVAGSRAERDRIISKPLALWSALGARMPFIRQPNASEN